MSADRTVHAFSDQMEVVRYDRAGKWYLEPKNATLPRQQVTLAAAVDYAMWAWKHADGSPCFGRPGGGAFDREVRKRCEPREAEENAEQ